MKNFLLILIIPLFISCHNTTHSNPVTNNDLSSETPAMITPEPEEEPVKSYTPPQLVELPDLTGIWVYEKCDTYGGYENGYGTDIPKEELEETFKDVVIEFYRDFVCMNKDGIGSESYGIFFEPEEWDMESFFAYKVGGQETPEQIKTWFKETFDVTIEDEFPIYNLPGQQYPYNRLIICPEKILMFTYGAWYASFTHSDRREYSGGEDYNHHYSAEMENYYVWYYKNRTIEEVYQIVINQDSSLEKEIPTRSVSIDGDENDNHLNAEYTWKNRNELTVSVLYNGGVTSYEFKQDSNGTELTIIYSAD